MNVMRSVPGPSRARGGGRRSRNGGKHIYGLGAGFRGIFKGTKVDCTSTNIGSIRSSLLSEIRRRREYSTESDGTSPSVSKILSNIISDDQSSTISKLTWRNASTNTISAVISDEGHQLIPTSDEDGEQNCMQTLQRVNFQNTGQGNAEECNMYNDEITDRSVQQLQPGCDLTENQEGPLFSLERIAQNYVTPSKNVDVINEGSSPGRSEIDPLNAVFKTPWPRDSNSGNTRAPTENMMRTPSTAYTLPRLSTPLFSPRETSIRSSRSSSILTKKTPASGKPETSVSETSRASSSDVLVAMTEGRGYAVGEVGLAFIDSRRHILTLCQISDSQTYLKTLTKIMIHNPSELVVPDTFVCDVDKSDLLKRVAENFRSLKVVSLKRQLFNAEEGLNVIRLLSLHECSSVDVVTVRKYYALSAAAAILKYAEHEYKILFAKHTIRVCYESAAGIVTIDMASSRRLELVAGHGGFVDPGKYSLLGIMDSTVTLGGRRRLRLEILQPPVEQNVINERLDLVELLEKDSELFTTLKEAIANFSDAEKLMWLCRQTPDFRREKKTNETITNYVLLLKNALDNVPLLRDVLSTSENDCLLKIREVLSDQRYQTMVSLVADKICQDAKPVKGCQAEIKRCFSIKEKVNGLLDMARETYCKLLTEIEDLITNLSIEHGLQLRMVQSGELGYHGQFVVPKNSEIRSAELPPVFTDVKYRGKMCHVSTNEMFVLNNRIYKVIQEIQLVSNAILYELMTDLRPSIGCLHNLCENISFLDFICSLTQYSRLHNMVRPTFGDRTEVIGGRHPILDSLNPVRPLPNDIIASRKKNFHIITGPNMGGKTIYLLQVVLLQIMAQVGCYVPANSALFRITDHIFVRKEDFNDMANQASSFHVEVKEIMHCLNSITPTSLILMDEMFYGVHYKNIHLGHFVLMRLYRVLSGVAVNSQTNRIVADRRIFSGTNNEVATVVSWAVCEQLLSTTAFTFFTTHLHALTNLEKLFANVTNSHMEAIEATGCSASPYPPLTYTYRLLDGVTPIAHYGLRLVLATTLPEKFKQETVRVMGAITEKRSHCWAIAKTVPSRIQEAKTHVDLLERFFLDFYELSKSSHCTLEAIKKLQQRAADTILVQEIRSQILNEPGTPISGNTQKSRQEHYSASSSGLQDYEIGSREIRVEESIDDQMSNIQM